MAKRHKKSGHKWCVFAGKTKITCHAKKSAAKKAARARRKSGRKAAVRKRSK